MEKQNGRRKNRCQLWVRCFSLLEIVRVGEFGKYENQLQANGSFFILNADVVGRWLGLGSERVSGHGWVGTEQPFKAQNYKLGLRGGRGWG